MRINTLKIENFRGVKLGVLEFPCDSRVVCLIGPGDSTKSTILNAISWALWPTWNLSISDIDFFQSNTDVPIKIEATLSEIPDTLMTEDKFGLYLRGDISAENDEPISGHPPKITVKLEIDDSLEPQWSVICNRREPKQLSYKDRQQLSFGIVGASYSKDMDWSRNSVLHKFINPQSAVKKTLAPLMREITDKADFSELNGISDIISEVANIYGVQLIGDVVNRFSVQSSGSLSSVGLFNNDAPLSQSGLGSQRLLSMGMQIRSSNDGAILLIDEIETGLEPFRIRNLINELRNQHTERGQVFFTTHSQTALVEMRVSELLIIQSTDGTTYGKYISTGDINSDGRMQALLRRFPEAFLSRRIVICEGKTETGFIRALDNYLERCHGFRCASSGTYYVEGGGSDYLNRAILLKKCGYDISILVDSDRECDVKQKDAMRKEYQIPVFCWDNGNSIEEQIFKDVDHAIIEKLIQIAIRYDLKKTVIYDVSSITEINIAVDGCVTIGILNSDAKKLIGTIAKEKDWFKRIDSGEELGDVVFSVWDKISDSSATHRTLMSLINWVRNDG